MTKIFVVSARRATNMHAQQCAQDFEDAIIESTGAHLFTPLLDENGVRGHADLQIFVALSFRDMEHLLAKTGKPANTRAIGYIFGAYPTSIAPRRDFAGWRMSKRMRSFSFLDRLYVGIADGTAEISDRLGISTHYLPMAADVLAVDARPYSQECDRPITVSGFGRQHVPTMNALADHFNSSDRSELVYATNFVHTRGAADIARYRTMFWQILRQSKLSLAFDQVAAPSIGGGHLSYVGPRWFESLAAGTVVVGWAPRSEDYRQLLNWKDSTIELPKDHNSSVEVVADLMKDCERLKTASARNLSEMSRRHDWRHRLRRILQDVRLDEPPKLSNQLDLLAKRAADIHLK